MDVLLGRVGRAADEFVTQRGKGRFEHAFDRYLAVLDVQPGGLSRGIVPAHLRGVARGHGHRVHAVCAERIDRDAQCQRRVDASGQAHDHAGKTVLVDVVAGALDQGAVDGFLLGLQRHDRARHRSRARFVALDVDRVQSFRERRCAQGHLCSGVHHEGISVENQLILSADQIHEHQR